MNNSSPHTGAFGADNQRRDTTTMDWTKVSDYLSTESHKTLAKCQAATNDAVAAKYAILTDLYMTLSIALLKGLDPR